MPLTKEQMKEYRIVNKERIERQRAEYNQENKEQRAEYYQDNKEDIQRQRFNSEKQRKTRLEYLCEEIACKNCNKYLRRSSMGKHRKSALCKQGIDTSDWSDVAREDLRKELAQEKANGVNNGGDKK
jgi:hypothetical protein